MKNVVGKVDKFCMRYTRFRQHIKFALAIVFGFVEIESKSSRSQKWNVVELQHSGDRS